MLIFTLFHGDSRYSLKFSGTNPLVSSFLLYFSSTAPATKSSAKLDLERNNMEKRMLHEMVYYYENAIDNFDEVMKNIADLTEMDGEGGVGLWRDWTASNDTTFIYGETQTFDLNQIRHMSEPYKSKMEHVYTNIMKALHDVCKDYAESVGDPDEPRLFPVFNIKKYNTGAAMGAHYDQLDGDKTLRYSLVMYLNEVPEGGEISFKLSEYEDRSRIPSPDLDYNVAVSNNQIDFGVKPSAGSVIIFPSSAPYYHVAHTVKSGVKYMIPSHWIHNDMDLKKGQ